jgi:hypothetical protein
MSVPQKERPASMLRAMFAGLGSLLSGKDKVRSKPAAEAPANAQTTAPAAAAPETTAEPEATAAAVTAAEPVAVVETVTPAEPVTAEEPVAVVETVETAEPVTVVETAEPAAVVEVFEVVDVIEVTEPVAAEEPAAVVAEATTEPVAGGALPVANYDELTLASLRARLRNLSVAQLTQLVEYEKSHAARADVITMFERRIVKIQAES